MDNLSAINKVLVIDDEPDIRELLEITLARMDIESASAANIKDAKALLNQHQFGLCLTDMRLPDGTGMEIVSHIDDQYPELPVAVITAYGNVEGAVQALQGGAFDFVSKPVDLDVLRRLVSSALKLSPPKDPPKIMQSRLLGDSSQMTQLRKLIAKLARGQAPVYIHGESGVGKELVARELHQRSPRSEGAFIAVNCGAIPAELVESELFGHIKGSFSGAIANKPGLFSAANGGTLFLDEVGDLPLKTQVKLLRAIQERAIKPVGALQEQAIDVRILSATHRDLRQEIAAERFREDLYYRLNVIEVAVPALRDRVEDIGLIAASTLRRISNDWSSQTKQLSGEALTALEAYAFPGNVRELTNMLERAATLAESEVIEAADLGIPETTIAAAPPAPSNGKFMTSLADQERSAIRSALETSRWNKTAAAKELGMSTRQLRYRLKKFGIS